jgi:hypothetical protein
MPYRAFALLVAVAVASSAHAQTAGPQLLASDGQIPLSLREAPALFRQCSRDTPRPGSSFWLPSSDQIAELESRLPQFIGTQATPDKLTPSTVGEYARQYVGFTLRGTRLIYGSFFPKSWLSVAPRSGAIVICDGGPHVWGVVYDPRKKSFQDLRVNGPV